MPAVLDEPRTPRSRIRRRRATFPGDSFQARQTNRRGHDSTDRPTFPRGVSRSQPAERTLPEPSPNTRPSFRCEPRGIFALCGVELLLTAFSIAVALLLIIPFAVDLFAGWPFWRASVLFDVSSVSCGLGLLLLSWDVVRDLRRKSKRNGPLAAPVLTK